MKAGVLIAVLAVSIFASGAVFAACGTNPSSVPTTQTQSTSGMQQMTMPCPMMDSSVSAITVDNNYVYIVSNDELLKLRKDNLSVVARTPLAGPDLARVGRGPVEEEGTPMYSSGSWIDYYAPTGDLVAPVFRAYDYEDSY